MWPEAHEFLDHDFFLKGKCHKAAPPTTGMEISAKGYVSSLHLLSRREPACERENSAGPETPGARRISRP
jgi:hypothetical protein